MAEPLRQAERHTCGRIRAFRRPMHCVGSLRRKFLGRSNNNGGACSPICVAQQCESKPSRVLRPPDTGYRSGFRRAIGRIRCDPCCMLLMDAGAQSRPARVSKPAIIHAIAPERRRHDYNDRHACHSPADSKWIMSLQGMMEMPSLLRQLERLNCSLTPGHRAEATCRTLPQMPASVGPVQRSSRYRAVQPACGRL